MENPQVRVVRAPPGLVWRALEAEQQVGAVSALLRPDNRWFVHFDRCRDDSYGPLLAAVAANTESDLYANSREADNQRKALFTRLGFTVSRRESIYAVPTDPEITGLVTPSEPDGFVITSAVNAFEDELRLLDNALRQDVPGASGWKWDPGDFYDETFGPDFDPATYLVAIDTKTSEYIGLIRVWNNPGRPRLGLVGVQPAYRRRGLSRALLGRAFAVLHERGKAEVTAEVDDASSACRALLGGLGARRIAGSVEWVRRRRDG